MKRCWEKVLPCLTLRFLTSLSTETCWSANLFSSEGCQSKDIDLAFDCESSLMARHVNVIEPGATMEPHGRPWRLNLWEGGALSASLTTPPCCLLHQQLTIQGGREG